MQGASEKLLLRKEQEIAALRQQNGALDEELRSTLQILSARERELGRLSQQYTEARDVTVALSLVGGVKSQVLGRVLP